MSALIAWVGWAVLAVGSFLLMSTGRLTLDTGWGRRTHALGPQVIRIAAPREQVFDLAVVPYGPRPPHAFRKKVEVLERGADMVVAAHRTRAGRLTAVTVESVTFRRPEEIRFRLLRGPVPFVIERFALRDLADGTTELEYSGVLGTDGWAVGAAWGSFVARYWEKAVADSLAGLKSAAERAAVNR